MSPKFGKNKNFKWSELVQRLLEEHKTETFKEYIAATKDEQRVK